MIQTFETYMQSKGLSPSSIGCYKRIAEVFNAWYGNDDIINCQKKDILNYLNHLKNKDVQTITRNHYLIALHHYFEALTEDGLIASNPTAFIKLQGVNRRKLSRIYTPEELTELVDKYYLLEVKRAEENLTLSMRKGFHKIRFLALTRNYAMLQFFVWQGVTSGELLRLKTDDIQLHRATVTIPAGIRQGNTRTLPLHATQIGSLIQYLNEIRPYFETKDTNSTLFLPIPQNSFKANKEAKSAIFKPLILQLKQLDRNFIDFVQLRTSVITYWIKNYGLRKAQYLAGHKCITSTEDYLPNHIEDLADDITKFNPF